MVKKLEGFVDQGVQKTHEQNNRALDEVRGDAKRGDQKSLRDAMQQMSAQPKPIKGSREGKNVQKGLPGGEKVNASDLKTKTTGAGEKIRQPAGEQKVADGSESLKKSERVESHSSFQTQQTATPKTPQQDLLARAQSTFIQGTPKSALMTDISRSVPPSHKTKEGEGQEKQAQTQVSVQDQAKMAEHLKQVPIAVPTDGGQLKDPKLRDDSAKTRDRKSETEEKKVAEAKSGRARHVDPSQENRLEAATSGLGSETSETPLEKPPLRVSLNQTDRMDPKRDRVRDARDKYFVEIEKSLKADPKLVEAFLSETSKEIEEARMVLCCYGPYGGIVG